MKKRFRGTPRSRVCSSRCSPPVSASLLTAGGARVARRMVPDRNRAAAYDTPTGTPSLPPPTDTPTFTPTPDIPIGPPHAIDLGRIRTRSCATGSIRRASRSA